MKTINKLFNPKKIILSGKCKIIDTGEDKYVVKEKINDINSLYEYLNIRNFNNYPKLIDSYDNNNVFEYVKDGNVPLEQKCIDMAKLLSNLHNKTVYFKTVSSDYLKSIYENILNNILYFEDYFNKIYSIAEAEEYSRPSYYLLLRNRSKINGLIEYLKKEIELWYKEIYEKDKIRVIYCHNNLSIDHFIESEKKYFISWDNYQIDSPVLDIINLYKNDYGKYDFSIFLAEYLNNFDLLNYEKKLLFIMISLPDIYYFIDNEFNNTINISKFINYINNTEILIRPYYSIENKE